MKFRISPLSFLILLTSIATIGMIALFIYINDVISTGMPSLEQLENPRQNLATSIYSADGELLDQFYIEKRINLDYDEIPKEFINALITSEDRVFNEHWGVHIERIVKAVIKRIAFGQRAGASTITQQLARNLFLDQSPTLERKIREATVAVQIEETYTKQQILELYANTVHFGRGAYGLEVAAQTYFGKTSKELNLSECATLVGVLPRPVNNPINNYDRAIQRRNIVLYQMLQQGVISSADYNEAKNSELEVVSEKDTFFKLKKNDLGLQTAPHFIEMIRQELKGKNELRNFDLYRDGLVIHTTLNSKIQQYLNEAVEEHLTELQAEFDQKWSWKRNSDLLQTLISEAIRKRADYQKAASETEKKAIAEQLKKDEQFIDSVKNAATTIQIGATVINPYNGAILAMVGASPKFMRESSTAYSLNHATQIQRQPGSSFKPFVYSAALNNGITPEDTIECGPFEYELPTGDIWAPRGTGRCEEGEYVDIYNGLRISINTVAARLITSVTNPYETISVARKAGITSPLIAVPAIALGAGGEVIPLQMTSAYGTFVYNGLHVSPFYLRSIHDNFGNTIIEKGKNVEVTDALSKEISIQMTYLLEGVANFGTGRRGVRTFLGDSIDAAGKTGTTNDAADAWYIGFTPQLVAGIWLGFDDLRIKFDPLGSEGYGGRAAAPIWGRVMAKIYADPSLGFNQKRFPYKNLADSLRKFDLPYPLTDIQKITYMENNPNLLSDSSSKEINLSEPESEVSPLLQPLRRNRNQ